MSKVKQMSIHKPLKWLDATVWHLAFETMTTPAVALGSIVVYFIEHL